MNVCLNPLIVKRCRVLAITLLIAFLAACQNLPKTPNTQAEVNWRSNSDVFVDRQQFAQERETWQYSAKVGLSTPKLNEQANLIWEFTDQANSVRMFGPLGVGTIKLQFDEFGVVLSDNKGVLHRGDSAEQLLTHIVGWPIPIDALSSWMFVLPAPGAAYRYALNENRQVERLEQLGWLIQYSDYRNYQGQSMPRKIIASKTLSPSKKRSTANKRRATVGRKNATHQQVVVKLITKSWKL